MVGLLLFAATCLLPFALVVRVKNVYMAFTAFLPDPIPTAGSISCGKIIFTTMAITRRVMQPCQHWQWHWSSDKKCFWHDTAQFWGWRVEGKENASFANSLGTFASRLFRTFCLRTKHKTYKSRAGWTEMCFPRLLLSQFNEIFPLGEHKHLQQCVHWSLQKWNNILNTDVGDWIAVHTIFQHICVVCSGAWGSANDLLPCRSGDVWKITLFDSSCHWLQRCLLLWDTRCSWDWINFQSG